MSTKDYSGLKATATRLITKFGRPAVVRRPPGVDSGEPFESGSGARTLVDCKCVRVEQWVNTDPDSNVRTKMTRFVVEAQTASNPTPDDEIAFGLTAADVDSNTTWHRIKSVSEVQPGDTTIVYKLDLEL